jgi:hypothetical protein
MQIRTKEVIDFLDQHRATLEQAVESVPETQRERRPAADRWSVAEVLEHLNIVEGSITKLLTSQVSAARASGLETERETTPVIPTVPIARLLDRTTRITAGAKSLPSGSIGARAAWTALAVSRHTLREFVLACDGLALSALMIPHPLLGPLNVYQWLVFLGAHEERHAAQIREMSATLEAV